MEFGQIPSRYIGPGDIVLDANQLANHTRAPARELDSVMEFGLTHCQENNTFHVSRRRREMYCGHARLCMSVCVSVCMPTLLHGAGCNLAEW